MWNAEGKMRNGNCGKVPLNGGETRNAEICIWAIVCPWEGIVNSREWACVVR